MSLREITKDTTLAELETMLALRCLRLDSLVRSSEDDEYSVRLRNRRGIYYGTGKTIMAAFRDALDDVVCSEGAWSPRKTPPKVRRTRRTTTKSATTAE